MKSSKQLLLRGEIENILFFFSQLFEKRTLVKKIPIIISSFAGVILPSDELIIDLYILNTYTWAPVGGTRLRGITSPGRQI